MSRVAKIPISLTLIEHMLPPGSKLLAIQTNEYGHTVDLLIEHESFDEVPNGEFPPTKTLMVHKSHYPVISKVEYAS